MDRLKAALLEVDKADLKEVKDKVEVVGQTIASCLNRASEWLNVDLASLDYEILEKGQKSLFNSTPYRVLVSVLPEENPYADLEEFGIALGVGERMTDETLDQYITPKHVDGRVLVRIYRSGVFLTVYPPLGQGRKVDLNQALMRIQQAGVNNFDNSRVDQCVKDPAGEPIKIANYEPKPQADSSVKVEISPDEMKALVKVQPPKPGGRHLEVQDVVNAIRSYGVVLGIKEEEIERALMEDRYMQEIVAAEGVAPKHGQDARIDYKVNIHKDVEFEEDSSGKVDFKKLNLVENVVVGQILAEKIPATRGTAGRTLMNRIIDARDGKDIELKQGKGTILSEDKTRLIAEINGQVVFSNNKIAVEPVYRVVGDVGPKTGNIMFLGSVVIGGNVLDNYEVKAAGNVDIAGVVQKAKIEAEGDIIVKSGILGREGAHVESTGGSIIAKFIQSARVIVAGDVTVSEGILHSDVEAGGKIWCNGRRAQINGGNIRATKEVRAKMIGSKAYTETNVVVGVNPRILAQCEELAEMLNENDDKRKKLEKEIATLEARQKSDPDSFGEEQQARLEKSRNSMTKLKKKQAELQEESLKLDEYLNELGEEGKVHAEKEVFPGVTVTIKDASQQIADNYKAITMRYDNGYVKFDKLEKAEVVNPRSWRR